MKDKLKLYRHYTRVMIDYPVEMTFKTRKLFRNLEDRTNHIQSLLKKKQSYIAWDYTDYIVEKVERPVDFTHDEYWIVGS